MITPVYADRVSNMKGSVIRELLKLTEQPDIISFGGGLPSPDSFPVEKIQEITDSILGSSLATKVLQYSTTEGLVDLREWIAGYVKERGISANHSDVLILSGSQQGIELVSKVMLNPGDVVLVERPTYLTAINVFKAYQADIRSVESDEFGIIPEKLEEAIIANKPKLVYLIPTFQNPSGVTLTKERRSKVMEILTRHKVVTIEDDPYGALRYDGEDIPYLKSYDTEGICVLLGSFSKVVAPGLRVGYAVAAPELLGKMVIAKQGVDMHTGVLSQKIIAEFGNKGYFHPHVKSIKDNYKVKRDLMLTEMEKHFPEGSKWNKPDGGLFIWCVLPGGIDTPTLLEECTAQKVAFIPGSPFFVDGTGNDSMRLNFSNATHEKISFGIEKLGSIIKSKL